MGERAGRVRRRRTGSPKRSPTSVAASERAMPRLAPAALALADRATRHGEVTALQRTAGNRAVVAALTGSRQAEAIASGSGSGRSVSLHGRTDAAYDGGRSAVLGQRVRRGSDCDCPDGEACLQTTGRLRVRYRVRVTITMPDVPSGLTPCQQRRVRAFLSQVLRPHEEDHARRFRTYNGTTTRRFRADGCGRADLRANTQSRLQQMHDSEAVEREQRANALSAEIDPFERTVDLDCDD